MDPAEHQITNSLYADGQEYDRLYSAYEPAAEVAFCSALLTNHQQAILDLACGTGRVAVPLAVAGFNITAVDLAEPMLQAARLKAEAASARVEFIRADMRAFDIDRKFDLVVVLNNSIGHLLRHQDLAATLACVRRHLTPKGLLVLDYFNPSLTILSRAADQEVPVTTYTDEIGRTVEVAETTRYDAATQVSEITWYLRPHEGQELRRQFALRNYFPAELDALIELNGLRVIQKYGSFAKEPFASTSRQQVLICADAA